VRKNSFALRFKGVFMELEFITGSIIIINTHIEAKPDFIENSSVATN
jgi:hypothetical protein